MRDEVKCLMNSTKISIQLSNLPDLQPCRGASPEVKGVPRPPFQGVTLLRPHRDTPMSSVRFQTLSLLRDSLSRVERVNISDDPPRLASRHRVGRTCYTSVEVDEPGVRS